jgi:hypothetical protein
MAVSTVIGTDACRNASIANATSAVMVAEVSAAAVENDDDEKSNGGGGDVNNVCQSNDSKPRPTTNGLRSKNAHRMQVHGFISPDRPINSK